MTLARKAAAVAYAVTGVISVVLGSIYVLRDEFMPYHADALGQSWSELPPSTQTLLLALMDVAGAGWAVTGLVVLILVLIPFRQGAPWARWLIPVALTLLYVPILAATLSVLADTPAAPPWYGNLLALLVTAGGFLLDRPWQRDECRI